MRYASEAFKTKQATLGNTIPSGYLERVTITQKGSAPIVVTFDDIWSQEYTSTASESNNLLFGYAAANAYKVSLDNADNQYKTIKFVGERLLLEIGLEVSEGVEEYVKIGEFTIEKAERNEGVVNISAIDDMVLMDELWQYTDPPLTLYRLAELCCEQVGLEYSGQPFHNQDYVVSDVSVIDGLLCRKIISLIGELSGSFAILNEDNKLEFRWFDMDNPIHIDSGLTDVTPDEETTQIAGAKIFFKDEYLAAGSTNKSILLTKNNPLLSGQTKAIVQDILDGLYLEKVRSMLYYPAKISGSGNPLLEVGDTAIVTDLFGEQYKVVIALSSLTDNLLMSLTSTGKAYSENQGFSEGAGAVSDVPVNEYGIHATQLSGATSVTNSWRELCKLQFSATTDAILQAVGCLYIDITTGGLLEVHIVHNGFEHNFWSQTVTTGKFVVTVQDVLQRLTNGGQAVTLEVKSDNVVGVIQAFATNLIVQGTSTAMRAAWDGTITVKELVPYVHMLGANMSVLSISESEEPIIVNQSPTLVSLYEVIHKTTVSDVKMPLLPIATSNCPCVLSATNPDNTTIEINFASPVYTEPIGNLDYSKFVITGFIGIEPTIITVHAGALENLGNPNLLDGAVWEQGGIDGAGAKAESLKRMRTGLIGIEDIDHYFMNISGYANKFADEKSLQRYAENQLGFYSEIQLEGRWYKASIYFYGASGYIGDLSDITSSLVDPPDGTTGMRVVVYEVSDRDVSVDDLSCFVAKLEVGESPTLYHWSNKIMLGVDDLSVYGSTISISYEDTNTYGIVDGEKVEATTTFERVVYP